MSDEKKEMTPEEIKAALDALGVEPGGWQDIPEKIGMPSMLLSQVGALTRLRDLLQGMAEDDAKKVTALREQMARLQYGGGS